VIQEQTLGSSLNSTINMAEAISFSLLPLSMQEEYLQDSFLSKGHQEGADNLITLSDAITEFGWENVVSYTITI